MFYLSEYTTYLFVNDRVLCTHLGNVNTIALFCVMNNLILLITTLILTADIKKEFL